MCIIKKEKDETKIFSSSTGCPRQRTHDELVALGNVSGYFYTFALNVSHMSVQRDHISPREDMLQ